MAKPELNGALSAEFLQRIRDQHPLIHHMTNFVVMNDTANLTIALGASPVMAHAIEEVEELAGIAGALVLNPGTLTPEWVDAMLLAGKRANAVGVPIIYDPVGVGATRLRNETARRFFDQLQIAVVRGNSGEIGSIAGAGGVVKGVDSVEGVADPVQVARDLARKVHAVIAISGKRDILSDGERVFGVDNGDVMLKNITGSGCMATTAIACFCAVEKDALLAATASQACYGLAAEYAAQSSKGPGTFREALLDAAYNLTSAQVKAGVQIVDLS